MSAPAPRPRRLPRRMTPFERRLLVVLASTCFDHAARAPRSRRGTGCSFPPESKVTQAMLVANLGA